VTECIHSACFLLPPLLTIAELQIPLPGSETHWESDYQQWLGLPSPQSLAPVCVTLARTGLQNSISQELDRSARFTMLLSAFSQHTATQNFKRALAWTSGGIEALVPMPQIEPSMDIFGNALDVLLRHGCSQAFDSTASRSIANDFAIASRVFTILSFTPARLLFPFSRWQTSDRGTGDARKELFKIVQQDTRRTRYCMYQAAQLFQHFRTIKALSHTDTIFLLICTLYMLLYVELVVTRDTDPQNARLSPNTSIAGAKVIRLDQLTSEDAVEAWLTLRNPHRLHVTGIGLLDADRSVARLSKESSNIMANSASTSNLAAALSVIMTSHATGDVPDFQEGQPIQ
jgi:hypothetical protein